MNLSSHTVSWIRLVVVFLLAFISLCYTIQLGFAKVFDAFPGSSSRVLSFFNLNVFPFFRIEKISTYEGFLDLIFWICCLMGAIAATVVCLVYKRTLGSRG